MIQLRPAVFALGLALVLTACQQQSAPTAAAPAAPARAAAPATPTPTAAAAAADGVGIAECDDYLNKYHACVQSKVPENTRAALIQSLDQTRAAWRTTLAAPGGKDSLAAACKQMRDATRASMSAYGCTDF